MEKSTKAIRIQQPRTSYREHSVPLFLTSSFVYNSAEHAEMMFAGEGEGDIYSRFTNPNTTELIKKYCALEEAEDGIVTASGMAAIFCTLTTHLSKGDHIIAASSLFGNTNYIITNILPKWGIEYTFVDVADEQGWERSVKSNTKMVLIETPTNPGLEIIDVAALAAICKKNNIIFCVDNCFATPILQRPMNLGADIVIHSATKWIDGQGRVLGGIVVGHEEYIQPIFDFLRRTGSCLSPFNAWVLSKSTETLSIRMERHCQNALSLAGWLEKHPGVRKTRYPYLPSHPQFQLASEQMSMGGGIVSIDLNATKDQTFDFINHLKIASVTANLGDSRTIVTHPATTTHSKLTEEAQHKIGIHSSTVRISVGLEDIDDIIADFDQALKASL